jgi:hypothetical protein
MLKRDGRRRTMACGFESQTIGDNGRRSQGEWSIASDLMSSIV